MFGSVKMVDVIKEATDEASMLVKATLMISCAALLIAVLALGAALKSPGSI